MTKKNEDTSPLVAAAQALDAELKRYAEIAATIARSPLDSEKAIDRMTRAVTEAAESEQRLLENVGALSRLLVGSRETQETAAAAILERSGQIAQRRAELDLLRARLKGISTVAKALAEEIQKASHYKPDPYDAGSAKEVDEAFFKIEQGVAECAKAAQDVVTDSNGRELEDIARQADGVRQQLLSTKNRVSLLRKQLAN